MKDLILVVADKNMHFALRGALNRPEALGIRPITVEFFVHPGRDGGVRKENKVYVELEGSPKPRMPVHSDKIRERAVLLAHLDAWDLAAPPQLP
jgi:hypothetical protein